MNSEKFEQITEHKYNFVRHLLYIKWNMQIDLIILYIKLIKAIHWLSTYLCRIHLYAVNLETKIE